MINANHFSYSAPAFRVGNAKSNADNALSQERKAFLAKDIFPQLALYSPHNYSAVLDEVNAHSNLPQQKAMPPVSLQDALSAWARDRNIEVKSQRGGRFMLKPSGN